MRTDHLLGERYRLVQRLAAGGTAVVWRGFDEVLERRVAIKILDTRLAEEPTFRDRLRTEARAAAQLSHPHIANVFDYGESVGPDGARKPYVVMELVDGRSLASYLADGERLAWPVAVTVAAQVAQALDSAHAHGVVHRDVTPGNVMLTAAGAKLVDFGISAVSGAPDCEDDGNLLGTPAYLAPERIAGKPVTPATDVYALGLILHRSLAGRLPWQAETGTQMLRAHQYAEPLPMPPIDGLPEAVVALCRQCLAKQPADRPSAAQVAEQLATLLSGAVALDPGAAAAEPAHPTRATAVPTSLLPHAVLPESSSISGARAQPRRLLSRRLSSVLVGAALLLTTGLVWAGTHGTPGDDGGREAPQALATPPSERPATCAVEHRMRRDNGKAYTASVTVRNTGSQPLRGWELTFHLPGEQRLTGGTGADWTQSGRSLAARASGEAPLPAHDLARLTYSAAYHGANPMPTTFTVNRDRCAATLLASPSPPHTPAGETPTRGTGDTSQDEQGTGEKGEDTDSDEGKHEDEERERDEEKDDDEAKEKGEGTKKDG